MAGIDRRLTLIPAVKASSIIAWCAAIAAHFFVLIWLLFLPDAPIESKSSGSQVVTVDVTYEKADAVESVNQVEATSSYNMSQGASLQLMPKISLETAELGVASIYHEVLELTRKPLVKVDVPTELMLKVDSRLSKSIVLSLMVNEYGDVDRVIPENEDLPLETLQRLISAFQEAKFYPGEISGVPVKSHLRIVVRLDEPAADPTEKIDVRGIE